MGERGSVRQGFGMGCGCLLFVVVALVVLALLGLVCTGGALSS